MQQIATRTRHHHLHAVHHSITLSTVPNKRDIIESHAIVRRSHRRQAGNPAGRPAKRCDRTSHRRATDGRANLAPARTLTAHPYPMRAGPLTKVPREIIISTSRPRRGRCRCVHSSSQSLARRSRGRRQQASRSARETDSYASESRPPVARRCLHRRHTPPPSHNARCHGDDAHKQHAAARPAFVW